MVSLLDGLPATIGAAFESVFKDATLTRVSARASDGRGGFSETRASDACKALVVDYTDFQRFAGGIPAGDRKIMVLASTLTAAVSVDDEITIDGRLWRLIEVTTDPAKAVYEARGR